MTQIGYIRTRPGEDVAPLHATLTAVGCTTIYCDDQVTLRADWPQLDHALAAVRPEDTLTVCRLIHLGRSLEHLAGLLADLTQRGIRLRALQEQLDTTEHGEQLLNVTHGLVEVRRAWRSENTREGLAAAVAAGRRLGRQPTPLLTPQQDELARRLQDTGHSIASIATLLGVPRPKLYRALQAHNHANYR